MRELLTASYLATIYSPCRYTSTPLRLAVRERGHVCARVCVSALGVHLCLLYIKWFRTRRLAAVYPTNEAVRHVRVYVYINTYI